MNDADIDRTARLVEAVRNWPPSLIREASGRLLAGPQLVDIEAASACNVTCTFCPRDRMARRAGLMSPQTMEQAVELLPDNAVVMVAGLGEPLVNRHLEGLLNSLRRRKISACVVTNGLRLVPVRVQSLLEAGVAQIQVSYHGVSNETTAAIMPRGGDLALVDSNLSRLADTRPASLRVRLNFVLTDANAHELGQVRARAADWGFDVFVRRVHNRGGHLAASGVDAGLSGGCGIFASVTFITADGDVMSCVNDVSGESRLGSVGKLRWSDIVRWKKEHIARGPGFPSCAGCNDDYRWVILGAGGVDGRDSHPQGPGSDDVNRR